MFFCFSFLVPRIIPTPKNDDLQRQNPTLFNTEQAGPKYPDIAVCILLNFLAYMSPTVQRRPAGLALVAATPQVKGELGAQRKTFGPGQNRFFYSLIQFKGPISQEDLTFYLSIAREFDLRKMSCSRLCLTSSRSLWASYAWFTAAVSVSILAYT